MEKGVSLRTCASSVGVTPIAHAQELGHKNSHDSCTCPAPQCAISTHTRIRRSEVMKTGREGGWGAVLEMSERVGR